MTKPKIDFIRVIPLQSCVCSFGGQTYMLEPLLSGVTAVPHDDQVKKFIEAGYLKAVSEVFQAEPAF